VRVKVLQDKIFVGILEKQADEYIFSYNEGFMNDETSKSISLTLPKKQQRFRSKYLFPFFYGLLAEGVMRKMQCQKMKIDENDYFKLLIKTANYDTIGNVTVELF
jgi:HipA-like protein